MKRTMFRALSAALAVLLLCFALPMTANAYEPIDTTQEQIIEQQATQSSHKLSDYVRETGAVNGALYYLSHIFHDHFGLVGYDELWILPFALPFIPFLILIAGIISLFI